MKVVSKKVSEIILDPSNVRVHGEQSIESIKGSLLMHGQQKPIVVNKDGIVIAGNGTLTAIRSLGWDSVFCVVTDLPASQQTSFAIADNRTSDLSSWDWEKLEAQVRSLKDEGLELSYLSLNLGSTESLNELLDSTLADEDDEKNGERETETEEQRVHTMTLYYPPGEMKELIALLKDRDPSKTLLALLREENDEEDFIEEASN
jgi:ParB-like chromosome segregation protein Spo0J